MTDPVAKLRGKKAAEAKALWLRIWIGFAALVVLSFVGTGFYLLGPGPKAKEGASSFFVVEEGDTASTVARRLKQEGLVRAALGFRLAATLSGKADNLKVAEYEIPSSASPSQIARILASGEGVRRVIVLPEGWSMRQLYARLEANRFLTGDLPPLVDEGTLNPDTYPIQRGDTRADVVKRMQAAHKALIDELWLKRAPDLPISTKQEAVILASIVEKETGIAEERPRVAAVFVNRLRLGMKLQSDPTIIYGITKGAPLRRKIFKTDLENPHPWNTYVIQGLPPTPIANPGKDALAAVLNPPRTREIFFVADGTGGHVFAETYAEHNRNVQRWRAWRAEQEKKQQNLLGGARE
ncbi:endolytic murein transglycosylase [Candidatus Phycosocius bacilliformis]|uniref:Endolytic murein transglycosylase n=1 Tax=Candidatus Phycosocius bacilliformis TaxID=1445552 RepID=A0A2P2E8C5_9PROT|nr:endolytic transglycosylase MltG [Candidatus Phycosocius bacilliformis]GBF57318.1 endolytic murein transglycosylase [Candidatus Phycosocius bacilliformis]